MPPPSFSHPYRYGCWRQYACFAARHAAPSLLWQQTFRFPLSVWLFPFADIEVVCDISVECKLIFSAAVMLNSVLVHRRQHPLEPALDNPDASSIDACQFWRDILQDVSEIQYLRFLLFSFIAWVTLSDHPPKITVLCGAVTNTINSSFTASSFRTR